MSKKKEKTVKKDKQQKNKKKPIKIFIIIFAIIALLAAATVVTVKVIVPKIKDSKKNNTPRAEVTQNYEYVKYGNGELPKDFCEILTVAQQDEAISCKNNGVAYTLGDREFSKPTILMEYLDTFTSHLYKASDDMETIGYSSENMKFDIFPEYVKYDKNQTWYKMMINESLERLSNDYYFFDKALSEGFKLTDEQVKSTANIYKQIKTIIDKTGQDAGQLLSDQYGTDQLTFEIYAARQIISVYASTYKNELANKNKEDISVEDAKNHIKGSEYKYMVFSGRILPITNEVDGAKMVTNEKEYIEYAQKVLGDEYDATRYTAADYANYETVIGIYGDIVADYIFSKERKSGEISLINNDKYDFLIYIDKPAYYETSVNSVVAFISYGSATDEQKEKIKTQCQEEYDKIVKEGAKKERFIALSKYINEKYGGYSFGYIKERVDDCHFQVNKWLRDPARTEGDHEIFYIDDGIFIVYYECLNKDDYDWIFKAQNEIALEKIESEYSYKTDSLYVANYNSKSDAFIQSESHYTINKNVDFYIVQRFGDTLFAEQ